MLPIWLKKMMNPRRSKEASATKGNKPRRVYAQLQARMMVEVETI
jgi:hypothetical protein